MSKLQTLLCCLALMLGFIPDVAAVQASGIRIVNDQWPDASTMERFTTDAFRLMDAHTEEEKALALFRFIRMFTARTTGKTPREPALGDTYIDDPLKVLNVYGAHHCDGLTRVMELAWRSRHGQAQKLYRSGHTQADVQWQDQDGIYRGHLFDMSEGWYVYDRNGAHIAGADEIALDYSLIFRPSKGPIPRRKHYWGMWNWIHAPHLAHPDHDMALNLRVGEKFTRHWGNTGQPYQNNFTARGKKDFEHGPYPVTFGNGLLEYTPNLAAPDAFAGSTNLTANRDAGSTPVLHPDNPGQTSEAVFRIASPYIIADAWLSGSFRRGGQQDELSAALSTDGGTTWKEIWQADDIGRLHVEKHPMSTSFDIYSSLPEDLVSPFGRYEYLLKIRMVAAEHIEDVGVDELTISTITQHNIFALPMPWPGTNRITVFGDIPEDISLRIAYIWDDLAGQKQHSEVLAEQTPFSFEILTSGKRWQDVLGRSISIEAVPRTKTGNRIIHQPKRPSLLEEIGPAQVFPTSAIVGRSEPSPLKSVEEYIADLKDRRKQIGALSGLMVIRDSSSLEAVEHLALHSIRHPKKDMAIQALYLIAPEESRPVLLEILESSPRVRWKHDPKNEVVELGHWYNIAALIGHQMVDAGESAAVPLLMAVLESAAEHRGTSWQPHASIIRSLGRLGDPKAALTIRPFLDGPLNVVAAAALALGELQDTPSRPRLKELFLTASYPMITHSAGKALIQLEDRSIIPELHELLQSKDENLRALAVFGLRTLGGSDDLAALEAFLPTEPFPWVREMGLTKADNQ